MKNWVNIDRIQKEQKNTKNTGFVSLFKKVFFFLISLYHFIVFGALLKGKLFCLDS